VIGLAYTDTGCDVEAVCREMRKLDATSDATSDFTLCNTSAPEAATGIGNFCFLIVICMPVCTGVPNFIQIAKI